MVCHKHSFRFYEFIKTEQLPKTYGDFSFLRNESTAALARILISRFIDSNLDGRNRTVTFDAWASNPRAPQLINGICTAMFGQ